MISRLHHQPADRSHLKPATVTSQETSENLTLLSWALCPTDIWTRGFGLLFIFFPDYPKTKPDKISKHTHLEMGLTKKEIIGSY